MYRILPILTEAIREERGHEFEREQGGGDIWKVKEEEKRGVL